jgi:hypothetical protein
MKRKEHDYVDDHQIGGDEEGESTATRLSLSLSFSPSSSTRPEGD